MALTKPYFRLYRPLKGYDPMGSVLHEGNPVPSLDFLGDDLFACQAERRSFVTAAKLILDDLYELFNYIEPDDVNLKVYSHRIYELFLRTATEFESNCKGILKANGYSMAKKNLTIDKDYFKLSSIARLSEYKVLFDRWKSAHVFMPFAEWNAASYAPLTWYQGYNSVKHNRYTHFNQANLENLINAFSALLCILFAQYGEMMAYGFVNALPMSQDNQKVLEIRPFTIIAPSFPEEDQYGFIWDVLKKDPDPVQRYPFFNMK